MNRRIKFLSLTLSMVLCLAMMMMGVYAATSGSITAPHSVQFSATSGQIEANIGYETVGAREEKSGSVAKFRSGLATADKDVTWTVINEVHFKDDAVAGDTLVITFTIENVGSRCLDVSWSNNAALKDNVNVTLVINDGTSAKLDPGAEVYATLTWTLVNDMENAAATLVEDFKILLSDGGVAP